MRKEIISNSNKVVNSYIHGFDDKNKDRIFFENITGYGLIAMVLMIMFLLNPITIFLPVTLYYTTKAITHESKNNDIIW